MRFYLFLFSLFNLFFGIASHPLNAQQYNSLLWRITGNGLSRPSYLFGTMHVTDKRVFFFTDSLYRCLEQSEGFAAELDLNSFMAQYLNEFLSEKEKDSDRYLVDDLNENMLSKYKAVLEKKFKKPIDKITEKELKGQGDNLIQKMLQEGEMPTFMDAYLFDIASKQGKWVGGIEDFEDQYSKLKTINIEEELDQMLADKKQSEKGMEWMIQTYLKQDLEAIDRSDELWQGTRDYILIKRNEKMSRRIDSLASIRSCLFAIGAAHLPGDSGVVSLLRKRGFTVSPVFSSQKIPPDQYKYKGKDRPWAEVVVRDSSYSIQMPSRPDSFNISAAIPFDIKMNFDLSFMRAYLTMCIPMTDANRSRADELLDRLVSYYKKNAKKFEQKDISLGEAKGKEILFTNDEGQFRMQIFIPGNYAVLNLISAYKNAGLFGEDPEHFFHSFKVCSSEPIAASKVNWDTYTFDQHAFSVMLPVKYREKSIKNESWYFKQYEALDLAGEGTYYAILINEAKPGYYSDEDSAYFEKQISRLKGNPNTELISSRHFFFNNFPALEAKYREIVEKENVEIRTMMVNRGNRRYYLIASYNPGKGTEGVERFFSSFTLLPIHYLTWQQSISPENSFRLWAPSDVREAQGKGFYYVYDSVTASSVYITKKALPDFYWIENDSLFFQKRGGDFVGRDDSITSSKIYSEKNLKGIDLIVQSKGNQNLKRVRVLLNGDTVYSIYGYLPSEQLQSDNYEKLFTEFDFINSKTPPSRLFQRKPQELLKALTSKDSAKFEMAKEALAEVEFNQADLPLLEEALFITYNDSGTNSQIIEIIQKLDNTNTLIPYLRATYKNISLEKEWVNPFIISYLSGVKTREAYELLKEILTTQRPRFENASLGLAHLYDSLKLTRILFPELLSLVSDKDAFPIVTGLTIALLDNKLIDKGIVANHKEILLRLAKTELSTTRDVLEANAYKYGSLVRLLGILNTAESNSLLQRFMKLSDKGVRLQTCIALLKNNQTVKPIDLFTLATSDGFRGPLYDSLKEIGKEKFFPPEFLSQRQIAQSRVYNVAAEFGDGEVPILNFIGERTLFFRGKEQKFYLFKMSLGLFSAEYYLGTAGPYSLNLKNLSSTEAATGIYWKENIDRNNVEELFRKYLNSLETKTDAKE